MNWTGSCSISGGLQKHAVEITSDPGSGQQVENVCTFGDQNTCSPRQSDNHRAVSRKGKMQATASVLCDADRTVRPETAPLDVRMLNRYVELVTCDAGEANWCPKPTGHEQV